MKTQQVFQIGSKLRIVERFSEQIYFYVQDSNDEFYLIEFPDYNTDKPNVRKTESYMGSFDDSVNLCVNESQFGFAMELLVVSTITRDKTKLLKYNIQKVIIY